MRREPPLYRVSAKNEIAILRELDGRSQTLKLLRDFEHTVPPLFVYDDQLRSSVDGFVVELSETYQ